MTADMFVLILMFLGLMCFLCLAALVQALSDWIRKKCFNEEDDIE